MRFFGGRLLVGVIYDVVSSYLKRNWSAYDGREWTN